MTRIVCLISIIIISACSEFPTLNLKLKVQHNKDVDEKTAQEIALAWVYTHGMYKPTMHFIVYKPYPWRFEACMRDKKDLDEKICGAKYRIGINEKETHCMAPDYAVIEDCKNGKCVYEFGPDEGEVSCW